MTTQIIEAFKKAGLKMTKAERIWLYLKDKPGRTVKQIEADLHMQAINAPIHYMREGGLLRVEQERFNNRKTNVYYAKGAEFSSEGLYSKPKLKPAAASCTVVTSNPEASKGESKPIFNLETLTIGEARNLYSQLKKMFGA